jgi:hypothetical protein
MRDTNQTMENTMEPAVTFDYVEQQKAAGNVYLCEVVDDLYLYHYHHCTNENDGKLKQIRGIIFDVKNQLVMRGFPFTPEYILRNEAEDVKSKLEATMHLFRFYDSYEGTIIRVFYNANKWHVSTHKKINAKESRWAGKESFETLFQGAIDKCRNDSFSDYDSFFNMLCKDRQYMFLLRTTSETRIVSANNSKLPPVFHVGTFIDNKLSLDDKIDLPRPIERKFETFADLKEYVQKCNPMYLQGVIAMNPVSGFYKVTSNMYADLYELRGNQPNLILRYLQLSRCGNFSDENKAIESKAKLDAFVCLYTDKSSTFHEVEKDLMKIAQSIHNVYIRRFVKKTFAVLPPLQYEILKKCHGEYLSKNIPVVTCEVVYRILNLEPPETLLKILS